MRTILRVAALFLALAVVVFWFARGANTKWTKNSAMRVVKDPVTEIEGPVYEKRFVPGIDFLGEGLAGAALVAGASFLFRRKSAGTGTGR
jgi:hypothetical protein